MSGYIILRNENVSKILKNKPRWVVCIVCTISLIILTLSAISAGILIGYTYCYVENRSGFKTVNSTQEKGLQLYQATLTDSLKANDKKTINEAIYSLVKNIFKFGNTLWDNDRYSLPWMYEEKKVENEI